MPNHPTIDLGKRTVKVGDSVLIDGEDSENLKKGESIRLLGMGIFKIVEDGLDLKAEFISENAENIEKKIQWVAEEPTKLKIIVPDQLFFGEKLIGWFTELRKFFEDYKEEVLDENEKSSDKEDKEP